MLGQNHTAERSLSELADRHILKDALVEEALVLEDFLVPVSLSDLGCEVDASLVCVGKDELEAEVLSLFAQVVSLDTLDFAQFVADNRLASAVWALKNKLIVFNADLVWFHTTIACSEVALVEEAVVVADCFR